MRLNRVTLIACLVLAFPAARLAAQDDDYVVPLTEDEQTELQGLDPGQIAYARFLLTQQSLTELDDRSVKGAIGILPAYDIINPAPAERGKFAPPAIPLTEWGVVIDQVVDERNAIARNKKWWLEGWDTANWYDGDRVTEGLKNCVVLVGENEIIENKIVDGRKVRGYTLRRFVRVEIKPAADFVDKVLAREGYRIWEARNSDSQIAKFVRANNQTVTLSLPTKKKILVEISQLSKDDQEWIESNK